MPVYVVQLIETRLLLIDIDANDHAAAIQKAHQLWARDQPAAPPPRTSVPPPRPSQQPFFVRSTQLLRRATTATRRKLADDLSRPYRRDYRRDTT